MIGKKDADRYTITWNSRQAAQAGAHGFQISPTARQLFGSIDDPIVFSGQVHFSPQTTERFKTFITEWIKNPGNVALDPSALDGFRTVVHETFHTLSPMVTNLIENSLYRREAFRFIEEGLVEYRSKQTILKLFSSQRSQIQDHINRGRLGTYRRETNMIHSLHRRYGSKFVDDVYETGIAENRKNKIVERVYRDVEKVIEKHGGAEALDDLRQNYSNNLLRPGISYWGYLHELIQTLYEIENGVRKVPDLLATIRKMRV